MIAIEKLAEVFVEVADTLVDDFDVIEFLEVLTQRTAQVSLSSAAGLVLSDPRGHLQFVAASRESVHLLELFQLQNDQGPCLDCFRSGRPVVNGDLDGSEARDRWPSFADRAIELGFRSVHAFPLRHQGVVIGAMNLFSSEVGRLDESDARVVQALADVATIGILQERTIRAKEVLTEQLQAALVSRITIEQAKGALARSWNVDVDAAFTALRDYARTHHLRLSELAHVVVTDPGRHPGLTRPS
ncbi:GAF and ANTAR domain-containing protein [Terrabacter sp. MAHUQ-38]|uniref:GAF and ANTAR domain-containing protein n=1 Tax=unclassified Terrabacter TaxID=2630222 RepID=UPI00165E44A8|nr:GAF and ANTAR domain-containing protein [Terrabacter sp. MAHUQ-38]MBC9824182.1 GAF and ANTAR domain-containing protein [Terrabacter sp. MAHUQ-38]